MIHSTIPSPTQGVWQLGPLPVRAYALCILVGIVVAIWLGDKRWRARGGRVGDVLDIAAWAVPFGIVGGRLYHVITSYQPYFGHGGHPIEALYIWRGGLGIWGAVALGGVGAWIGARRMGILLPPLADALAPGIVLAQAIGRWGNWFNNELYGGPTTRPWGLQIHQWDTTAGKAVLGSDGKPIVLGTFQPTFLYESLWDVGTAVALILLGRRFKIGHGRLFATYVALYTVGRFWIETLRTDPATHILGLRINLWTSVIVFAGAVAYIVVTARTRPGLEAVVLRDDTDDDTDDVTDGDTKDDADDVTDGDTKDDADDVADGDAKDDTKDETDGDEVRPAEGDGPDAAPGDADQDPVEAPDEAGPDGEVPAVRERH